MVRPRIRGKRLIAISQVIVIGTLFGLTLPTFADDQADNTTPVVADPEGTSYATGLSPISPETFRSFKTRPAYRAFLPIKVDLSKYFPKPGDQGQLGSCTGWAVGYAARSYYSAKVEDHPKSNPHFIASPEYVYLAAKKTNDCSQGSAIPDALDVLKAGAISVSKYPFAKQTCAELPQSLRSEATELKITDWRAVNFNSADNIKGELAQGNPVIVGMSLDKGFFNYRGSNVLHLAGPNVEGGHAVTITGYDDQLQAFRIINSWGTGWGDKGYAWLAYDSVLKNLNQSYVMEVEQPPPPVPDPLVKVGGLSCAKVVETTVGNATQLTGFVGKDADLDAIRQAYAGKKINIDVSVRPWPQCEILQTLDKQLQSQDRPTLQSSAVASRISAGSNLTIDIKTPGWPAYIYASYIQADGSVVTLSQPQLTPPTPTKRSSEQLFGDGKEGRAKFTVAAPFGREMAVVLAARSPLFDNPMPATMTEREYLSMIRRALIYKPDPAQPDREVSASVLAITTEDH